MSLCALCVAHMTSYAQSSMTGAINTMAVSNSIIRSDGDSLVVYSEFEGQGYFHLLSSLANGSVVKVANVPDDVKVNDFKILDGNVYFVGVTGRANAVAGYFNLSDLFYNGGSILYKQIIQSGALVFLSLDRMEVYLCNDVAHIIAVGNLYDPSGSNLTGYITTFLMDIQCDLINTTQGSYEFISSGLGFGWGVFFDIAMTDNYFVSVAHKGVPYDLSVAGYIMLCSFPKNDHPLQNMLQYYTLDNNINGSMAATGTVGDRFAVTYSTQDLYNLSDIHQEVALFSLTTTGTFQLLSNCQASALTGMPYRSYYDMDYNNYTGLLCEFSNSNTTGNKKIGITSGMGSIEKVQFNDFKINSVCSANQDSIVACGDATLGTGLYVGKIAVPTVKSQCINKSPMTLSQIFPTPLIGGSGSTAVVDSFNWEIDNSIITTTTFTVICKD